MSSDKDFIDFIVDQMGDSGSVNAKKMFGDYGVYCNGKIVALVCDNKLFVKPTQAGKDFIGNVLEAEPYTGAKPWFLIQDQFEDREWISELIRLTYAELPEPKEKKPRSIKKKK
ncbi:MAG: TfoX/Sxy family protein [Candidatus Wallbacteria bacterium]|nr:TfoX/Sxy family protein [Candidatus Wallbacteria bacterium]